MPGDEETNPTAADTISDAKTTTQIPLPKKFESASTAQSADAWAKWLRRFDRVASGLSTKPGTEQVSIDSPLCY